MEFTETIEALLKKKNISKKEFLEKMELNKNSFSDWGKRRNLPNGDILIKFADFFSVSVDHILGRDSNPLIAPPQGEVINITNEKENGEMSRRIFLGKKCYDMLMFMEGRERVSFFEFEEEFGIDFMKYVDILCQNELIEKAFYRDVSNKIVRDTDDSLIEEDNAYVISKWGMMCLYAISDNFSQEELMFINMCRTFDDEGKTAVKNTIYSHKRRIEEELEETLKARNA